MKILVLNPITQKTKNIVRDVVYGCWCNGKRIGGATVPPFALVMIATVLRRENLDADFLDAQAEQISPDNMQARISAYDVVIMSSSTMSFREDADYLRELKQSRPGLISVIFGSHPTFMAKSCLAHSGIDMVVRYEPEMVLKDLCVRLNRGEDIRALKGIGYKNADGMVINDDASFMTNLDRLPFPDVDLLPKGIDYFNPIVKRTPYMTTTTSRGCPGKCIFCTAPAFDGPVLRFQSAQRVIAEIEYFVKKGIKEIYFRDDTFFVNKTRDHAIFDYLIDHKTDITWIANGRINLIDEETIKRAKQAGCHTIKFGIESGSQTVLDTIKKGYTLDQAVRVFDWARRYGIKTHAHLMLGNPGDTRETVEETIRFALQLDPTTATFGICTPYPGTPLFDAVQKKYPEIGDGSSSDLSVLHVKGLFNETFTDLKKDELTALVPYAYKRFYGRPIYWLKTLRRQITGPDDIKRLSIAATNVFNFILSGENE
jgi:anaerobic magnesium-protoporphyrin IX monomethyl ester cyclase